LILTLAQAVPASQPGATAVRKPWWVELVSSSMFPLVLGLLVLYMFVFRSKKKQENERRSLLDNLKKGDEIQTIGGVLGKVIETRDDRVQIKVDESSNTKIWFSRSAIHKVLTGEKAEAK
jgi:preprotein translocase subunit YajC